MLLICPIMMHFMHRGDKNHIVKDHTGNSHDYGHHNHASEVQNLGDYKVKQLEEENKFLKRQNELL